MPELVSTDGLRLYPFGAGLADGCQSKQQLWGALCAQIEKTAPEQRNIRLLLGFLSACADSDAEFYHSTLDDLINDPLLGMAFPQLQVTAPIDKRGIERLHQALDNGKANIYAFQTLAYARAHESINDEDLAEFLRKILTKEDGIYVAVEILGMRFHGQTEGSQNSDSLIAVGREALSKFPFADRNRRNDHVDYSLEQIIDICLAGEDGKAAANDLCGHLAEGIETLRVYAFNIPGILKSLARSQPVVFLDIFLGIKDNGIHPRAWIFSYDLEQGNNPLNEISDGLLLDWCNVDPENRYPILSSTIHPFSKSTTVEGIIWKPIVNLIFERAPNLELVFEGLAHTIRPKSWIGSMADALQERATLFQSLYHHENEPVRALASRYNAAFQEEIKREREDEAKRNRRENETFE
jgi:hypothetical protein